MANTAHAEHNNDAGKKEVRRVTIILTVVTLIELALGYIVFKFMEPGFLMTFTKGVILVLMVAKAFYIVAYFMHLGHELRNMIMTIVVPLGLFIWFIIAFLYDGASYRHLRNTYDPAHKEITTEKTNQGAPHGKEGVKDVQPAPPRQEGQQPR